MNMHTSYKTRNHTALLLALSTSLSLGACASGDDPPDADVGAASRALGEACMPAIAWDDASAEPPACAGPWEYQAFSEPCYALSQGAHCDDDPDVVTVYEQCRHRDFGLHQTQTLSFAGTESGYRVDDPFDEWIACPIISHPTNASVSVSFVPGSLGPNDTLPPDPISVTLNAGSCSELASVVLDYYKTQLASEDPSSTALDAMTSFGSVSGNGSWCSASYSHTCTIHIVDYPEFNWDDSAPCDIDHTYLVHDENAECRDPSHGPGFDCPTSQRVSAPGMLREQLDDNPGDALLVPLDSAVLAANGIAEPLCTTCEHLPLGATANEVTAKYECLSDSLERVLPAPTTSVWPFTPAYDDIRIGDVNGDKRADMVARDSAGNFMLAIGNTNRFTLVNGPVTGFCSGCSDWVLGDVNGDRNEDIIGIDASGPVHVMLSNKFGLGPSNFLYSGTFGTYGQQFESADVNGDNLDDLVAFTKAGAGSELAYIAIAGRNAFTPTGFSTAACAADEQCFLSDITGDGRADIVLIDGTGVNVAASTGLAFSPQSQWNAHIGSEHAWMADIDGNGIADVVTWRDGGFVAGQSDGSSLDVHELPILNANDPSQVAFAQLGGALSADMFERIGDNVEIWADATADAHVWPTIADATMRAELMRSLSLLFDYRAHELTAEQRDAIVGIINDFPASAASCDPTCASCDDMAVPFAPAGCPSLAAAEDALRICARLVRPHVNPEVMDAEIEACLSVGVTLTDTGDPSCDVQPLRDFYALLSARLFDAAMAFDPDRPGDARDVVSIRERLRLLNAWYEVAQQISYSDPAELASATSARLGQFWSGIPVLDGNDNPMRDTLEVAADNAAVNMEALVEEMGENALMRDILVLQALFPGSGETAAPPIDTAPLLYVLSDAFQGMRNRNTAMIELHDFACLYADCAASGVRTPVSELWALWAVLDDSVALQNALALPAELDAGWRDAFTRLLGHHDALQAALADAFDVAQYDPILLTDTPFGDLPAPVVSFATLVFESRGHSDEFAQTGYLSQKEHRVLPAGIQESQQTSVSGLYSSRLTALNQRISTYRGELAGTIANVIDQEKQEQEVQSIRDLLIRAVEEFYNISEDIAGLRITDEIETRQFAEFVDAFVSSDFGVDPDLLVDVDIGGTFAVYPQDARFDQFADRTTVKVEDVAVEHNGAAWTLSVQAGDVVRLQIDDQWSPTCALNDHYEVNGTALTGPEGYLLQETQGGFEVVSNTDTSQSSSYDTSTLSERTCNGTRTSASINLSATPIQGNATGIGSSFSAYEMTENCTASEHGSTNSVSHSNSTNEGTEARWALNTATGVRVPNTPVPDAPAGSLLLIGVDPNALDGDGRAIVYLDNFADGQVLRSPMSSFIAPRDLDLYLVINDRFGCIGGMIAGQLHVTMSHLRPVGNTLQPLHVAMGAEIASLRAEGVTMVENGPVLPGTLALQRSMALNNLNVSHNLDGFPPLVIEFFRTWLDSELTRIERRAELKRLERARSLQALDILAMHHELDGALESSRLLQLIPHWLTRTVTIDEVWTELEQLTDIGANYMHPILRLRYPAAVSNLGGSGSQIAGLLDLDPSAPLTAALDDARDALEEIKTAYDNAIVAAPGTAVRRVAFRFPNPGVFPSLPPLYRTSDAARAAQIWNGIYNNDVASIQLRPEDMYRLVGASKLDCNDNLPVIQNMAVFLALPGTTPEPLNDANIATHMTSADMQPYINAEGTHDYRLNDEAWLSGQVPLKFGEESRAGDIYDQSDKDGDGSGLSLFTRFDVYMPFEFGCSAGETCLGPLLSFAEALIVFFDVEVQSGPGMNWVQSCSAP